MSDLNSILFPGGEKGFRQLSATASHDLGLDSICKEMSDKPKEQKLIMNILSMMTPDVYTADFRHGVFMDILRLPEMRKRLTELFDRIEFLNEFGTLKKKTDEKLGIWYLLHRLDELNDYIKCVEAMRECLDTDLHSEGLMHFRDFINSLYEDSCFAEMKEDIKKLKMEAAEIKSVTLGVNLNERFEAASLGLISINSKPFKKSNIVTNFADAVSKKKIHDSTEWDGDMHYHQVEKPQGNALDILAENAEFMIMKGVPMLYQQERTTVAGIPEGDGARNSTFYLEGIVNRMLDFTVKRLRDVLSKYVNVAVVNISKVIPEFIYYIRCAEFFERCTEKGYAFCEPCVAENGLMSAKGLYNLKLAMNVPADEIIDNDLDFDAENTIYILTGANRGGKTTVTQAVGLLYVLAQGGLNVPCRAFEYKPVDLIYTHFPADEDKTMDLGRLGEECVRFREIFDDCTENSLVLLNETFSTTSFEEGYYIAVDSVKALSDKNVRTIYNTHMHKLGYEASDGLFGEKVSSLIVKSENGKRSFKVMKALPEGMSFARDIAEKYGVTYDMLTGKTNRQDNV